jgi:hypothetical protein
MVDAGKEFAGVHGVFCRGRSGVVGFAGAHNRAWYRHPR